MNTTSTDSKEELMTLYVKTLAGDMYDITCPTSMSSSDFLSQVLLRLPFPSPHVSDLRLYPSHMVEAEEETIQKSNDFPIPLQDGDLFYLFVESPQLEITIQFEDNASLFDTELQHNIDMEAYRLQVKSNNGDLLLNHLFYTRVHHPYYGTHIPHKYYTNRFYHEDDIVVVYNPGPSTRANTGIDERDIELLDGAISVKSVSLFADMCPIPSYIPYLSDKIHEKWMEHVCATGMLEPLYH